MQLSSISRKPLIGCHTAKHLCMKLEYYGIREVILYTLHWLENFLSGRSQQVANIGRLLW